jgi:PAS domain-containing protein
MQPRNDQTVITVPACERRDDAEMFDLAPVSLWLEDYSGLKALFREWRLAGVVSLRDYLREDPARIEACSARIRVVKVNARTLALYEAADATELVENLGLILRDEMFSSHVNELVELWEGRTAFLGQTVNYTLSGRRLDIELKGIIMPGYEASWERILVAVEDVTERETARRRLAASEKYARGLFEHSPVSLWVESLWLENYRGIKELLEEWRRAGVVSLRDYLREDQARVKACSERIDVLKVNRKTLTLFEAADLPELVENIGPILRDDMFESHLEELVQLWDGRTEFCSNAVNYTLSGKRLDIQLKGRILPGYEESWEGSWSP